MHNFPFKVLPVRGLYTKRQKQVFSIEKSHCISKKKNVQKKINMYLMEEKHIIKNMLECHYKPSTKPSATK